jgi:transcriptional regulator with GAF, ATPase, and Fis domain
LQFDLPATLSAPIAPPPSSDIEAPPGPAFLTELEMQQCERANLMAVLECADWKIKGAGGAAELLGLKPTTLISRMKQMGLTRPAHRRPPAPAK